MADDAAGAVRRTPRPARVDQPILRDRLIEQAAVPIAENQLRRYDKEFDARHLCAEDFMPDAREDARTLAERGLLTDPEQRRPVVLLPACACTYGEDCPHGPEPVDALNLAVWLHAEAQHRLAEEQAASYNMYARVFQALGVSITAPWSGLADAARKVAAERDALQARIDAVRRWLDDPQDLTPAGQLHQIRAALQSDQHAELEPRCMNGPAKRDTLHMVGVIKALKSAAELDHLPLEPLRRDNFVRLARAIADHWPRDIDKPAAPFDLLETEEL